MGCWHGRHGCGPWYGPPYDAGWYEPERRRSRSFRRGREQAAEDLEDRLVELRQELHRLEGELSELRGQEEAAAEGP